jgi:ADP-ribose pyrophosphatase
VFDFFTENVTLPNGVTMDMDIIRHPGAAAIVPVMEDHTVLLLKQYRHAVGGLSGKFRPGRWIRVKTPASCAQRELTEETGYAARILNNWHRSHRFRPIRTSASTCFWQPA